MKNKLIVGLIAGAAIGITALVPTIANNYNKPISQYTNKILMTNHETNSKTNEAVIINGNSRLYALSTGKGIVSDLSQGEMLTILGNNTGDYCKVKVQETGAVGYIDVSNMQNITNGTNSILSTLSENGHVINVSSRLRIRSNPSINNNIIGYLSNGTNFEILGKQGQWYKVNANGKIGFIYEEYVSTNIASSKSLNTITSNNVINKSSTSNIVLKNTTTNSRNNNHSKNISFNINNTSNSEVTKRTKSVSTANISNNNTKVKIESKAKGTSNNLKKSVASFSLATISKDCYLSPAPNNNSGTSVKLSAGEHVFILNNDPNYQTPKGWVFVRTALGAGYLPTTEFSISNKDAYHLEIINKNCHLLSGPSKSAHSETLEVTKELLSGAQVFAPINNTTHKGWTIVFASSSPTSFAKGYVPTSNLTSTSRITVQG